MLSYIKAEVFSLDDPDILLAVGGEVAVEQNEDGTYLVMLKKLSDHDLLEGRIVRLVLYSTLGLQRLEGITSFIAENFQANFLVREWTEFIERRRHVKIPVRLAACLTGLITTDDTAQLLESPLPITIQNISVGGMLFACEQSLALNTQYKCTIQLPQLPIDVMISVIRKDVDPDSDLIHYGSAFQELSPSIDSRICHFIYQAQIEARKKEQLLFSDMPRKKKEPSAYSSFPKKRTLL